MKKQYFILLLILTFEQLAFAQSDTVSLPKLSGYSHTVYYSQGHEERAGIVANFMEGATNYFTKELKIAPKAKLFILAPQDWKTYAQFPVYGMPHNLDWIRLAIAAEENQFWQSFLPPLENLPPPMVDRINKAYRNPDGSYSMRPFFDLLALHELAHSYHGQAKVKTQRKWMGELLANIMLHTYVAEKRPDLLPALETFPDMVVGAGSSEYFYTSLADFEANYDDAGKGMTAKNYGWYQTNLHVAAKNIYNEGGKKVIRKLWKALKNNSGKTFTDEAFAGMLKKDVHPGVANVYYKWNQPDQWKK